MGLTYPGKKKTCDFRRSATSAPAEFGRENHSVSRNRACTWVSLQAQRCTCMAVAHMAASGWFDGWTPDSQSNN